MINVGTYLQLPEGCQTQSLVVHPEGKTKFMGYKTFYLLLSVITQSWPGHQTLIIIPESVHPCYDFHDKVTSEGICPPHTTYPTLCYISHEAAQLRENPSVGDSTIFSTSLADGQALHVPFPVCPEHRASKRSTPFMTILLCSDIKGLQHGKFLVTFSNPARANLNKCLTISSKHEAKVHQIHNSLKILEINCTWWLSFKNVLYIFLKGRDRWTNFHFKPPIHSRGKANFFSYFVKTQIVGHSLPWHLTTHMKQSGSQSRPLWHSWLH